MKPRYSIKTAAQISGLSPSVLRAWESRYSAISPERSSGNQRLYSDSDIERLELLARCVRSGHSISRIAGSGNEDLEELLEERGPENALPAPRGDNFVGPALDAVARLDGGGLEDILDRAVIDLGILPAIDRVIVPLMDEIGRGWYVGRWRVGQEHMTTSVLRTFLGDHLRAKVPAESAPEALAAAPAGQEHELGALSAALAAASAGYRVIYLGGDIPAEELVYAVERSRASLLLLSVVFPGTSTNKVRREIATLRRNLPEGTRLVLGGPSARQFLEDTDSPPPRGAQELYEFLSDIISSA